MQETVAEHTAGSPVNSKILWTNRSPREIAGELAEQGFDVCGDTVRRILKEDLHLGVRQAEKEEATCHFALRNEQFEYIACRKAWYQEQGWPVLSIDAKKKEAVGNFFRPGRAYTNGTLRVLDHDFITLGAGRLTPYGVYDIFRNEGVVLLTESYDTSELACDAIRLWWRRWGWRYYWDADQLLLLCDCGGSNGYRLNRFKEDLDNLSWDLDRRIEVAHYPPGCSKYNPIERRLFCHITRALKGVVLRSSEVARDFIASTTTTTGLRVLAEITHKTYAKARKATAEFLDAMPIQFHTSIPKLNYITLL